VSFHFRLARVLAVKKIRENQAMLKLAERTAERRKEEYRLELETRRLAAAWQGLTVAGCRSGGELARRAVWTQAARRSCREQQHRTHEVRHAWAGARGEFLARRAERQALTALRNKAEAAYRDTARREESKELDQVAGVAYLRRQREGLRWRG
jgi:flagellar export protein FliJ